MSIRSVYSSIENARPFYTIHLSRTWMVVHRWNNDTDNGAQVQIRMADGPFCPIIWGVPW